MVSLTFRVVLDESVESQLAVVLVVIARLLLVVVLPFTMLVFNSFAGRDTAACLLDLAFLLLTALTSGRLEFFHLSLTIGAQGGQAGLLGVALGLEAGLLFGFAGAGTVEQGAFAIADGFLLGATVQSFVVLFVVPTSFVVSSFVVLAVVLGVLLRESESGHGLLDAVFEFALQSFVQSFAALAAGGIVVLVFAFLLCGRGRRSAAIVSIASIEFWFQSFEFGLAVILLLLVAVFQALVESLEFGGAVLGQAGSNGAGDQQRDDDGFHFDSTWMGS